MVGQGHRLREAFERDGYVVLPGLLSPGEVGYYRGLMTQLAGIGDRDFDPTRGMAWSRADGVTTTSEFWPLIFNQRLLETIRALIGDDARYTQHSDLHVHGGSPGWHRDSADRRLGLGRDWDESRAPYKVIRVAIYLQSYAESGSALGLMPGTHRRQPLLNRLELSLLDRLNNWRQRRGRLPSAGHFLTLRPRWIKTAPGDCVIFHQRILHSASRITGPKYAIFLSYGADNEHSRNHRRYYMYERPDIAYGDYPPELAQKLRDSDLYLSIDEEPGATVRV